ncbi:MAG: DUF896 domain-containing protein [Lachnospiraceae bacterium]|nr:DUF896 domain-containing protein [Lachnospiraceae bacterium]
MAPLNLERINELARKSKAEGLTDAEIQEQKELRANYIANIRASLRGQLDNIDMIDKDGTIFNLGERYDKNLKKKTTS